MLISFSSFSNLGPRSSNQDRVLEPMINERGCYVAAIADGMGGATGGSEAADIAIDVASTIGDDPANLALVFPRIIDCLKEVAATNSEYEKMGTTLSVAVLKDRTIHVAHVGDTRIYHLRNNGLNTLTVDQTEVAQLRSKGVLTANQARRYPRRNVLLSALTPAGNYEIFSNEARLEVGDRLLFTTDGLHQRVKRGGILNASIAHATVSDFLNDVQQRAESAQPSDNYSALAIQVLGF